MRAVKAKHLRSIAKRLGHKLGDGAKLSIVYKDVQRQPKTFETGELNEDGTKKKVTIIPITRILNNCQREIYQGLKRRI